MNTAQINTKIIDFPLPATNGKNINLADLQGQIIVLYFYPKDNTPGCTTEGNDFKTFYNDFLAENAVVLGISRDTLQQHDNFKRKYNFPFELLSDKEEKLCHFFDVIKEKNMYGKKVMGIERSTFLIDSNGILRKEWRKVKIDGHVEQVLKAVKTLNQS